MTSYRWRITPLVSRLEERVGRRWVLRGEVRRASRRSPWEIENAFGDMCPYSYHRGDAEIALLRRLGVTGDVARVERRPQRPLTQPKGAPCQNTRVP